MAGFKSRWGKLAMVGDALVAYGAGLGPTFGSSSATEVVSAICGSTRIVG